MRFTADLAVHAAQRMNPLGEREVILRGYKIAAIENTGTLKDQFDVIDLSDNEITRVGLRSCYCTTTACQQLTPIWATSCLR